VQPEHPWGVELDESSHLCIDIYDNAMFLLAVTDFMASLPDDDPRRARWRKIDQAFRKNVRRHLWDRERRKFIPHLYLADSPFSSDLDERAIHYHGGTAVAILAGLLDRSEIAQSLAQMRENVRATGAGSIGLTIYPVYPAGTFLNPSMRPYGYQNGGDWTWFGARMVQALAANGFVAEAYAELLPMVRRVRENDGFFEWYDVYNQPRGSGTFRGSAGVLAKAILMLRDWAEAHEASE
jgi:hypothetical protein